jgi:chromosomal replication initiator protein
LIDGVLQLDVPRNSLAPAVRGTTSLVIGQDNALLAPPLERLLAATDCREIAETFNPLALVGPSGSGKSHIVHRLIRAWSERLGADAVAYYTAADFGRERQAADAENRLEAWRDALRAVRLLAIEDIDRLRPLPTIQRELRETIDAITAGGGMVLVTATREPFLCPALDSGVRDRLVAGLTIRIERPGLAARRAILAQAAAARGLTLESERLELLAEGECATPAKLMGRLNEQFAQQKQFSGCLPLKGRAVERVEAGASCPYPSPSRGGEQKDHARTTAYAQVKQILAVAARYFGVTQAAIISKSRRSSLVEARSVIVHLARRLTDLSYADIGRTLGNRDHTTIMHAERRLSERLGADPAMQQAVDELDRIVRI